MTSLRKHGVFLAYMLLAFCLLNTLINREAISSAETSANSQICLQPCARDWAMETDLRFKAQKMAKCHSRCLRNILTTEDITAY